MITRDQLANFENLLLNMVDDGVEATELIELLQKAAANLQYEVDTL